jgi:hypothetical protein
MWYTNIKCLRAHYTWSIRRENNYCNFKLEIIHQQHLKRSVQLVCVSKITVISTGDRVTGSANSMPFWKED